MAKAPVLRLRIDVPAAEPFPPFLPPRKPRYALPYRHPQPPTAPLFYRLASFPPLAASANVKNRIKREKVDGYMAKAIWNGKVVAESETYETVEGNIYFPDSSVKREYLRPSTTTSTCPWKGQARYYSLLIDGQENQDAAWYYPDPKPAARNVKNHIAFWRGVEVEK